MASKQQEIKELADRIYQASERREKTKTATPLERSEPSATTQE